MKRIALALLLTVFACGAVQAQSNTRIQAQTVATCGTASLTAGVFYPVTQDLTGTLCTASGGGGGGGAVTIADGADVTQGAKADAACGTATGTCSEIALLKYLNAAVVDTTPINVSISQTNGVTQLAGNGVTGTGSPRVTIASDNSPISGVGVGATAAAPIANAVQNGAVTGSATTGGKLQNVIQCDNHVFKHITSATDTLAVQGVTSQIIYVCAWRSRAAGDATWFLENTASVNANCSSSNTQITGVATETANSGEVFAPPFWTGLKNTVSNGLCINSTGTGGVDVDIWYTQF